MKTLSFLTLLTCVWMAGCGRGPAGAPSSTVESWSSVRDALVEDYLKAHPVFAVVAGRHEYDGQLPGWSAAGIAAEIGRLHAARDRATAFTDSVLADAERFERDYFVSRIDRDLFLLETAEAPFVNPAWYIDWIVDNLDPAPYLTRNYAPLEKRMRAYTAYARAIPVATGQIRASLRVPMARPLLDRGVSAFRGFADFYDSDVPGIFAGVKDAPLQKELADANAGAVKAMRDLAAWLESQRASATASYALGAEKFARMLAATEGVTTPLAELEAAGRADLARNQQALREACAECAPGAGAPGASATGRAARRGVSIPVCAA